MSQPDRYAVPAGLTARAEALWKALVPSRAKSPGRLALMEEMCHAMTRADQFRALILEQGVVTTTQTTGMLHLKPIVKAEREALAHFAKLGKLLSLDWDFDVDGRGR